MPSSSPRSSRHSPTAWMVVVAVYALFAIQRFPLFRSLEEEQQELFLQRTTTTNSSNQKAAAAAAEWQERAVEAQQSDNNSTPDRVYYYHVKRTDRSGSALVDMLRAHSYAASRPGGVYGGACDKDRAFYRQLSKHKHRQKAFDALEQTKMDLLHAIGLEGILPYNVPCPNITTTATMGRNEKERGEHDNPQHILLSNKDYRAGNWDDFFTPEWLELVRKQQRQRLQDREDPLVSSFNNDKDKDNTTARHLVAHIRRSDISPCSPKALDRWKYLPNRYYLDVIDHVLKSKDYNNSNKPFRVTIFSESDSHESFDVFRQQNYTVHLSNDNNNDNDLSTIWRRILTADVVVTSRSTFSRLPALFNVQPNATVIKDSELPASRALPRWRMPPRDVEARINVEKTRLQQESCPQWAGRHQRPNVPG